MLRKIRLFMKLPMIFLLAFTGHACIKDSQRIQSRGPGELLKTPPLSPPLETVKDSYKLKLSAWFSTPEKYTTSQAQVAELIRKAKLLGVETIYVSSWRKGCTYFPSQTMSSKGEAKICPGFDWLSPMLVEAKKSGIALIPWFEWGLHIPGASKLRTVGKLPIVEAETWWDQDAPRLDPFSTDVISFFSSLFLESSAFFGVKEVHLCDNHALKQSQLALKKKTGEDFTRTIVETTAKAREAGIAISFAALESQAAKRSYGSDWSSWRKSGLISSITSELYTLRFKPSDFPQKAAEEVGVGADQLGIYVGAAGNWSEEQILGFIQESKKLKVGVTLFEIGHFTKNKSDEELRALREKFEQ